MSEKTGTLPLVSGVITAILLALALLYVSRFWIWQAPWGNDGLLGLGVTPPGGDAVRLWLRGTIFSPFDFVIWGAGSILFLSVLQSIANRFK